MTYQHLPDMVPADVFNERKSICNSCPNMKSANSNTGTQWDGYNTCSLCGCNIFAIAQLKKESCPIGKWEQYTSS